MRGRARGRAAAALGVGAVLLGIAWRAHPLFAPPMYEGLTTPAAPYLYLHPPPGLGSSKHPSSVHQRVPLKNGQSPPLDPSTPEMPPQAQLLAAQDSFPVPAGAAAVDVSIAPVDPPSASPIGGVILGNVYAITVSVAGTPLPVRSGRTVTVALRGPAGISGPAIERYAGGTWTKLNTLGLGALSGDTQTTDVSGLGDFALVGTPGSTPGSGGDPFIVALAVGAVALTVGTLVGLRRSRRRPPPRRPAPGGGRHPVPRRRS